MFLNNTVKCFKITYIMKKIDSGSLFILHARKLSMMKQAMVLVLY